MVVVCAVVTCKTRQNKKDDGVHLYCFPQVKSRYNASLNNILARRRAAWIRALKRGEFADDRMKKMRICSLHFIEGKPANFQQVDHPDWVPSLNMGYPTRKPPPQQRLSRFKRRAKKIIEVPKPEKKTNRVPMDLNRTEKIEVDSESTISADDVDFSSLGEEEAGSLLPSSVDDRDMQISLPAHSSTTNTSIETKGNTENSLPKEISTSMSPMIQLKIDLHEAEIRALKSELQSVKAELQSRNDEVSRLREKLKKFSCCAESFTDDEKLLFYTGIPCVRLFNEILNLLNLGTTKLSDLSNSLDAFQTLLLVLMKLRLSVSFRNLAYEFGIPEDTASTIFHNGIILMYHALLRFVRWPSREEIINSVPQCYLDTFGKKVVVILDYLEVDVQKPVSLKAKAESSQCEQRNTIKYLISFVPRGSATFISKGWDSSTSDDHIIENSKILDLLKAGDVVLTNRTFAVSQEVGLRYAILETLGFKERKPQLLPKAIADSTNVSSVRIHVEKIIGTLRNKFKLLNGPILTTLLECKYNGNCLLDYIVIVCCALANMCDSVVPR